MISCWKEEGGYRFGLVAIAVLSSLLSAVAIEVGLIVADPEPDPDPEIVSAAFVDEKDFLLLGLPLPLPLPLVLLCSFGKESRFESCPTAIIPFPFADSTPFFTLIVLSPSPEELLSPPSSLFLFPSAPAPTAATLSTGTPDPNPKPTSPPVAPDLLLGLPFISFILPESTVLFSLELGLKLLLLLLLPSVASSFISDVCTFPFPFPFGCVYG